MRISQALASTIFIALTACGSGAEDSEDAFAGEAMSADEVIAAADGALRPEPGQYRSDITLMEVNIPGVPESQVDMMRDMMKGNFETTNQYCLTEAEVENGYEEMIRSSQEGDCSFNRFEADGGDIDAAMTCKTPQGDARMTMKGSGTPTSSDMVMTMTQTGMGSGDATIKMRVKSERVGPCTG